MFRRVWNFRSGYVHIRVMFLCYLYVMAQKVDRIQTKRGKMIITAILIILGICISAFALWFKWECERLEHSEEK